MPPATLDPATMVATPTTKTRRPAKKKAVGKPDALQAELKRQAELFLLGQSLMEEIASRDAPEGRLPHVAGCEWRMLEMSGVFDWLDKVSAELLRDRNQHALLRLVQIYQGSQQVRAKLKELPSVEQSKKNIVAAKANEEEAAVALGMMDCANLEPKSLKKIKTISGQLRQYQTQRVADEASLVQVRSLRYSLSLKAPHPLRQKVDVEKLAIPNKIELGELRNELSSIEHCISPRFLSPGNVGSGLLNCFAETYCPEAINDGRNPNTPKIDRDALSECVKVIRTEYIPALKNRIKTMQADVDAAMLEAEKPMEKWIDDGIVTIEMLLN